MRSTSDDGQSSAGRRAARLEIDDPARQGALRADIRTILDQGSVPVDTIDDVLIVVSELLSNAQEHGNAARVRVDLATHDHQVWTAVAYRLASTSVAPTSLGSTMPAPDVTRGRGLAIVDALATTHQHHRRGDVFCTECTFSYG